MPTDFRYTQTFAQTSGDNGIWTFNYGQRRWTMADNEGGVGLDFVSANDPRVPRSESEQMVAALRSRGVPVSYLLFADEGHGWRKKPNQDLAREVETVFLQRLFGTN